jgi:hypothetical protein
MSLQIGRPYGQVGQQQQAQADAQGSQRPGVDGK